MSEWISVKDRLPIPADLDIDYGDNVIGVTKNGYLGIFQIQHVYLDDEQSGWAWAKANSCYSSLDKTECEYDDDYVVTHWMPLPNPPELP